MDDHPPTSVQHRSSTEAEVVAFLKGRSAPCPKCGYDLRSIEVAKCPECGELLELTVGTRRPRFGWLILSMTPGCFSGVAAVFLLVPIGMTIARRFAPGQGLPWPVLAAETFGIVSAISVWFMYRHRHRLMVLTTKRQRAFAGAVWGVHVLAFALFVLAMTLL